MENLWYPAVISFLSGEMRRKMCCVFQVNLASVVVEMGYWQVAWVTLIGAKKAAFHELVWLGGCFRHYYVSFGQSLTAAETVMESRY